jgi:hypothetical protein
MEVAATGRPDAAPCAAGRALSALEAGEAIEALALEAVDLGPASAKLGKFELVVADEGVSENPPIAILRASDGIAVKDNARPFRCERAHGGGGVLGAALDRSAGLHVLRGVDALSRLSLISVSAGRGHGTLSPTLRLPAAVTG